MRVFVYEYTCATYAPAASSLNGEGAAMLRALVDDFARIPGARVVTLLHETSDLTLSVLCRSRRVKDEERDFRELARQADWTLVIAPEFDDLLATRCQWVLDAGGRLLGPTLEAVRLTADKRALADHLRARGVPTPPCFPTTARSLPFPLVCKPRFGAGSQATYVITHAGDLERHIAAAQAEMPGSEFLLQPFVPGVAASVAFLIGPNQSIPLLPAAQHFTSDGRLRYQGGTVPISHALAERATKLGQRAVGEIRGSAGFVGVDLVLGDALDGSRDWVIEINPRLTTSYVGLRRLAQSSLAAALLRLVSDQEMVFVEWQNGCVTFDRDGTNYRVGAV